MNSHEDSNYLLLVGVLEEACLGPMAYLVSQA